MIHMYAVFKIFEQGAKLPICSQLSLSNIIAHKQNKNTSLPDTRILNAI